MKAAAPPTVLRSGAPRRMSLELARARLAGLLRCVVGSETVSLAAAHQRLLSADILAPLDLPPANIATRDGYALRMADLAASGTTTLRLAGTAAAGHPWPSPLQPGEALRIFTGAVLPAELDLVVMQELCFPAGNEIVIPASLGQVPHIRQRGQDFARGQLVLRQGQRLRPADLGLAASLGLAEIPVYRPLRVALFSTGDELIEPGRPLTPGAAWDANRPLLAAHLAEFGCIVTDGGILPDLADASIHRLAAAAQEHDLIITSGGMSVGDEDHISQVIRRRGHLEIWQLAIKPGRPVGFGDIDDCPILALPGNPVAALVAFLLLGSPVIARLSGSSAELPEAITLPGDVLLTKPLGERHFHLGKLIHQYGLSFVDSTDFGETRTLFSHLIEADGLIDFAEDIETVRPGDVVSFIPFRQPGR